jgi:acid stress-induced BolA-like protein IbaG/YrbA
MEFTDQIAAAIRTAIPGAEVRVSGGGGHFEIHVVSATFEGQRLLQRQRAVYAAIAHLMAGDAAPLHAVDRMVCDTP